MKKTTKDKELQELKELGKVALIVGGMIGGSKLIQDFANRDVKK